jgi:hypothetical protein
MTTTELAAALANLPVTTIAEGNWEEKDSRYVASLRGQNDIPQFVGTGRSSEVTMSVREDKLYLTQGDKTMVMSRF